MGRYIAQNLSAYMKTLVNLLVLVMPAQLMQSCKKKDDTTDTTATSTPILQAYINGSVWTPDTLGATVTYTAATGIKEFSFTGTKSQKRVVTSVKQSSANNSAFPLATYKVDGTSTSPVAMSLYTQQLTSAGNYDFVLYGTAAEPGSGSVTISAVDTVKKTITGTYSFTSSKLNYDENGNYVSITLGTITSGQFNGMPYTFKRN